MSSLTVPSKTLFRRDAGLIERIEEDEKNGRLLLWARVRHVGPLVYRNEDGEPEEEFVVEDSIVDSDFINGMLILPVTDDHPKKFIDNQIDLYQRRGVIKGFTGSQPRADDDSFLIDFSVFNKELIKKIENGKRDVSLGHKTLVRFNPEKNRLEQVKTKPDHLAIVYEGRAPKATILYYTKNDSISWKGKSMKSINIDGVDFEVEDEVAKAWDSLKTKLSDAVKTSADALEEAKNRKREISRKEAKIDELEEALKAAPSKADLEAPLYKEMLDRLDVLAKAQHYEIALGSDIKEDSVSLKKKFIAAVRPKADLKDKTEDYISARYDSVLEFLAEQMAEEEELIENEDEEDDDDDDDDNTVNGFLRGRKRDSSPRKGKLDAFEAYKKDLENAYKMD